MMLLRKEKKIKEMSFIIATKYTSRNKSNQVNILYNESYENSDEKSQ